MVAEQEKKTLNTQEVASDDEELDAIAREQNEVISKKREHEEAKHTSEEALSESSALEEATELAKTAAEIELARRPPIPAQKRRGAPSKKQLAASYKSQLEKTQAEMSPSSRAISKFIHIRPVEATSDFIGSTIARPNALLSGSIVAFASVTVLYFLAKYYGFQLSGFETIAAFAFGWVLGILYDYFSIMIRGKTK